MKIQIFNLNDCEFARFARFLIWYFFIVRSLDFIYNYYHRKVLKIFRISLRWSKYVFTIRVMFKKVLKKISKKFQKKKVYNVLHLHQIREKVKISWQMLNNSILTNIYYIYNIYLQNGDQNTKISRILIFEENFHFY